ncbi:hypothetical protein HG549_13130 [Pseudomonas sp. SK]|uniref:hypothetical protein n=1 Tax=Pseudomonas sp. SK TaxID=2729423 RepID=UPI0014628909|nr:hypothetical protein [Pseudomonas sp. SK]QJQ20823.1 hypothetical protein HG549_13130 [Pseudomonas sp. SK]
MKMMTRKEFLEWFTGQVDCYEHANDPTTSWVPLTTALERWSVAKAIQQSNKVNWGHSAKPRRGVL